MWNKIYLDMGVKNQEELQQKLNKTTTERIFNSLKNEDINNKEINEIICIGSFPYSEDKIQSVISEIQNGLYEFKDETKFNYLEDYFLIYQISTKEKQYILIEINPYEMYDITRNLFFTSIEMKTKYHVPDSNIIFRK
jgi:hypothetical protein